MRRTGFRGSRESGQGTIEYVGIVVVIAVILSAFVSANILEPGLRAGYQKAICVVTGQGACPGTYGQQAGPQGGDQGDHGDQGDGDDGDSGISGFFKGVGHAFGSAWDGAKNVAGFLGGAGKQLWGGVTGLFGGLWDDVKSLGHVIAHPIQSAKDIWNWAKGSWNTLSKGFMERWNKGDYLGAFAFAGKKIGGGLLHTVVDDEVIQAWKNGDYGKAIGRALWNGGSWFIPVAGWAAKLGKVGKLAKLAEKASKAAKEAAKLGDLGKVTKAAADAEKVAAEAEKLAKAKPTKANKEAAARARKAADEASQAKIDAWSPKIKTEADTQAASYAGSQVNYTIAGGTATRAEAQKLGEAFVGPGYRVASDGKTLVSADGTRVYRPPALKKGGVAAGKTQANFEVRDPNGAKGKKIKSDGHLTIDPP